MSDVEAVAVAADVIEPVDKYTLETLRDRIGVLEERILFLEDAREALIVRSEDSESALLRNLQSTKEDREQAEVYRARLREARETATAVVSALETRIRAATAKADALEAVLRAVMEYALPGKRCGLCYQAEKHRDVCPVPKVTKALSEAHSP